MATREQTRQLLAVSCPWCGAAVDEVCTTMGSRSETTVGSRRSHRRAIRTLDGGCHDARWQKALGQSAPVLAAVVAEEHPRVVEEPQLVGASERPW